MTAGHRCAVLLRGLVCGLALGLLAGPGSPAASDDFGSRLARAALARTRHQVVYDGSYRKIAYPNGDVPANIGVCTDLVIRSYRALGVDLQRAVHEDMRRHFSVYPSRRIWGLSRPDPNIDHRRVPNLQVFLTRRGEVLPVSDNPNDYRPGDLVTWRLPGNLPHIGIVSGRCLAGGRRPLIVHNIGAGPQLEDVLFRYPITGHYRYLPIVDGAETPGTAPILPADRSRTEDPP